MARPAGRLLAVGNDVLFRVDAVVDDVEPSHARIDHHPACGARVADRDVGPAANEGSHGARGPGGLVEDLVDVPEMLCLGTLGAVRGTYEDRSVRVDDIDVVLVHERLDEARCRARLGHETAQPAGRKVRADRCSELTDLDGRTGGLEVPRQRAAPRKDDDGVHVRDLADGLDQLKKRAVRPVEFGGRVGE